MPEIEQQFGKIMADAMVGRMDYDIAGLLAERHTVSRRLTWKERFRVLFGHQVVCRFDTFIHQGKVAVKDEYIRVFGEGWT